MAGGPVQGNQMRIIGHHEYLIGEDGHATVRAQSGVSNEVASTRARIFPNLAPRQRIQRKGGIWSSHIHNPVGNDGCSFQAEVAHVFHEIACIGQQALP